MKTLMLAVLLLCSLLCGAVRAQQTPADAVKHEHAVKGDWSVSYYTDKTGKFLFARMQKTFDKKETKLRLSISEGMLTIDSSADFSKIDTKAELVPAKIYIDTPSTAMPFNAVYFEESNGEPWMSIVQPTNEPGIEDGFANGKTLFIQLGKVLWKFDLKGTNAAYKSMIDCFQKRAKK